MYTQKSALCRCLLFKVFHKYNQINHSALFLILGFLSSTHRCLLHHHSIVRLEGDRHHAGQLPAPVHPEIPAQTLLTSQLLQADHLELISKNYEQKETLLGCVCLFRFLSFFFFPFFWHVGDLSELHRLCFAKCSIKGSENVKDRSRWSCLKQT